MRSQRFGIEIEMTGITRAAAARVIAGYFHTQAIHIGGGYDAYSVRDGENRQWKVVRDSSIRTETASGRVNQNYAVELVSPICRYEDIGFIQEMVRELRKAGAMVNSSCGIHIHIDAASHTAATLRNLVNIMASKEDLLYKALDVQVSRERYCRKADVSFLNKLNSYRPKSMEELERIWYDGRGSRFYHYDESRYKALNLHSVFSKGTIEFRLFNSTLHAGKVKSYIQLCLAVSHQALVQKRAAPVKTVSANEKYTFHTWLLRLGLIGDEFKTARQHLLANLEGNIAWKDPAQAEEQKNRLAEQRRQAQQEDFFSEPEPEEAEENEMDFSMSM